MLKKLMPLAVLGLVLAVAWPAYADRTYTYCDAQKSKLCEGLVALFNLEEDSNYARTSETASASLFEPNGISVPRTTGKWTTGFGFWHTAGADSYLHIPNTVGLGGTFTAGMWIKVTTGPSADGKAVFVMATVDGLGNTRWPLLYLQRQSGGYTFVYVIENAFTGNQVTVTSSAVSLNTWYYVTFGNYASPTTSEPFQQTIWIALNDAAATTATSSYPSRPGLGNLRFGSHYQAGAFEYGAYVIDQLAVWSRYLTAPERASMYGAGSGLAYPFY
jgi:hypothetical protein